MTKRDAAEKVAKLRRLAHGNACSHEAATAKSQAEKLIKEHGLTDNDLSSGEKAAAFDSLVDAIHGLVASHPSIPEGLFGTAGILSEVLNKIKNIGETDKSIKLGQIVGLVRTASFIAGDTPIVAEIKGIVDSTLRKHEISM